MTHVQEKCPCCHGLGLVNASFATRLLHLRHKHGMKQQELTARLGVTRSQIANLELGRCDPSLETLSRAADAFGVTVDFMLGREPITTPAKAEGDAA